MIKTRDGYLDVVKLLSMLTVVFGHLGGKYNVADTSAMPAWYGRVVISVAMPLFFVISGYFAACSFRKYSMSRIVGKTCCFIWPQFVVGLFWAIVVFCITGSLEDGRGALRQMFAFWFLKNLTFIYLVCAIIWRLVSSEKFRWLLFLVVYLFMFFLPEPLRDSRFHWWTSVTIHMMPYFVFGLMLLRNYSWFEDARVAMICGGIFTLAIFLHGYVNVGMLNYWHAETRWRSILASDVECCYYLVRPVVSISGVVFALWGVRRLTMCLPALSVLAVFGTTTLGVYVFHEWPIVRVGKLGLSNLPLPFWCSWPLAVVIFIVCHYLTIFIRRHRITKTLVFGDEEIIGNLLSRLVRLAGKI